MTAPSLAMLGRQESALKETTRKTSSQGSLAFATLLIPALVTLALLIVARFTYPRPEELETSAPDVHTSDLALVFWIYMIGAALVAAGFADFC